MADKRFLGKTAVVTGSGRRKGLGEAIVRRLASEGANIVLSDIGRARDAATAAEHVGQEDEMAAIALEIAAMGVGVTTKACDVRIPLEVDALAQHAVDTFGSLDIWVNNAGIGYIMKPLLEVTESDWDAVIDVNLKGCFFGVQAAARRMIA
ncbi:MAG: SDR family NAD(P)-dependent oxidoreductase, partial [Hyphomonadaceae bacterium]